MRTYFTLLLFFTIIFYTANSQQWVSTQVEKRNVILEEFTGIHCGYCPDGHKRANELEEAYPGRVFLINIHAGGYANPGAGEPDLRTSVGTAIDGASGVTGYPAGSVNRSTSPWAIDRGSWASVANTIMNENSPVNVAVKAYVDFTSRELITEVEIYYTSNSSKSKNYLTVVLTQDNLQGPQSDYGDYNPGNWTRNGKYRHNHALRMNISSGGAFGESIDTTTKDHYEYRKYVTNLPQNITNLDVELYNLNVVAFVSENQSNIYSGAGTHVEFDPNLKVDLEINDLTVYPSTLCFTSIMPKIEVTNNSPVKNITGFDVYFNLDGEDYKKNYSGDLSPNNKINIEWDEIPFTSKGIYKLKLQGFENINGNSELDMNYKNDGNYFTNIAFKSKAFSEFYGRFDGFIPNDLFFDYTENTGFSIVNNPSCGANYSSGAVRFALHDSWGVSGKTGYIVFGEADLSILSQYYLCFYYAYSDDSYGGTIPQVKAQVSEDCGVTWVDIYSLIPEETGNPATHGNWYVPATTDYKIVQISLEPYKNKNVIFRIGVTPGTAGNALFIDELTVGQSITAVEEEVTESDITLYPNPATSEIRLGNDKYIGLNYSIYSVIGNEIAKGINSNNKIDINKLITGQYYIKINNEILRFVKN